MTLGYDGSLYVLAFDHRGSFQKKFFGIAGDPTPEETARISDAKTVIYEGLLRAIQEGAPKDAAGLLVDEQFGADIARKGKAEGIKTAMPVEKSGQDEFDFQYREDFGKHIEEFDPDFNKVLVRYNPKGDPGMNRRQTDRLKRLGDWLHEHDRKFLFELLVPAEKEQLDRVGGDAGRYDREVRPELMQRAIADLQDQGVEADIWKIEGIDDRESCREIAQLARREGRDHVSCVVLGRGASDAKVDEWLRAGAGLDGYIGFAIGRSIFSESVQAYAADPSGFDREAAVAKIAASYRRFVDVYEGATAPA
jgi:myo-inositol catabolism protein IolC